MFRFFKTCWHCLLWQPGRTLTLLSLAVLVLSIALRCADGCFASVIVALPAAIWQKTKTKRIDTNFAIMPSMPILDGKPYLFLYQKTRKDVKNVSCHEQLRSLIRDKNTLGASLPAGNYTTITHDSVLRVFRKCGNIHIIGEPVMLYKDSLRMVISKEMGGRCRRCKAPCAAFRSEPRNFYLVHFSVA